MGMSESHDSEAGDPVHAGHDRPNESPWLVRSQFTSTDTPTLDEAMGTLIPSRARRGPICVTASPSSEAITERVNAMKANIAKDLTVQHELTLDALENEHVGRWKPNSTMEQTHWLPRKHGLATNSTCDLNARSKHSEKHGVEQHQRLQERRRDESAIETQLHEEPTAGWPSKRAIAPGPQSNAPATPPRPRGELEQEMDDDSSNGRRSQPT